MSVRQVVRLLLLFAAPVALWPGAGRADAFVDNCEDDVGPGNTLAAAFAAGGRITFRCPGGSVIRISRGEYRLVADTTLVGPIILDGAQRGIRPPSLVLGGAFAISAERVEFRNFLYTPISLPGMQPRAQLMSDKAVVLRQVTVQNTERFARSRGSLEATNSLFARNEGAVLAAEGDLRVVGSDFLDNELPIVLTRGEVLRSTFIDNRPGAILARTATGPIQIANSRFSGSVGGSAVRLPVRSDGAPHLVALRRNEFFDNEGGRAAGAVSTVDAGGGLPPARLELFHNAFSGNAGGEAGAVHLALAGEAAVLAGNSFRENRSTGSGGGAVYLRSGSAVVTNSLFVGNAADRGSGAAILAAYGTEIQLANSVVARNRGTMGSVERPHGVVDIRRGTITNVTIADNEGPALLLGPDDGGGVRVRNTVLARNSRGDCGWSYEEAFGGPNLQSPNGGCPGVAEGEPALDPFYAPGPASPVIGAGDAAACAEPPVSGRDMFFQQRARGECALGALERPPVRVVSRLPREPFRAPADPAFPPEPFLPSPLPGGAPAAEAARAALEGASALGSYRAVARIRHGEDERVVLVEQERAGRLRVVHNPGGADELEMRLVNGIMHQLTPTGWRRASGQVTPAELPGGGTALRGLVVHMVDAAPRPDGQKIYVGRARWGGAGSTIEGTLAVVTDGTGLAVEQRFEGTCAGRPCRFIQFLSRADGLVVDEPP